MISLLLALTLSQLSVQQDGGTKLPVNAVNCIGPNVSCSRTGSTWQLSVSVDGGTPVSVPFCDVATQYVVADGGSFGCVTPAAASGPFAELNSGSTACTVNGTCGTARTSNIARFYRGGVGGYAVDFTVAPASSNHYVTCMVVNTGPSPGYCVVSGQSTPTDYIQCYDGSGVAADRALMCVFFP